MPGPFNGERLVFSINGDETTELDICKRMKSNTLYKINLK